MRASCDNLVSFIRSDIALCGVQGAGSLDFHRALDAFYAKVGSNHAGIYAHESSYGTTLHPSSRAFHERVWDWVTNDSEIRILYQDEIRKYSLSEFEALEQNAANTATGASLEDSDDAVGASLIEPQQPSPALLVMQETLLEGLKEEMFGVDESSSSETPTLVTSPSHRSSHKFLQGAHEDITPIFDDPESTPTAPRLFASQNQVWHALTGHEQDLKRVPSMEFALLSLIAARGVDGITQPELTILSRQDKRSVPHRTDELTRKGYIKKTPIQAGKIRTSLCVHTKFFSHDHFSTSSAVEDVFQEGAFVLSGFVHLLYRQLKDSGIVPTREIRARLGVPMRTWNQRSTQGALIRLDQTGMIKRFRVRKSHAADSWTTCIQVLRAPTDEDISNLGFRRNAVYINAGVDDTLDEMLEDDFGGDTMMRDLEIDTLEEDTNGDSGSAEDFGRIPPQWTPDRIFANLVFGVAELGGAHGWDTAVCRERIVGHFWRRPLDSYFSRLSDDWEKTQPLSLRHLAITRDSRNTEEKKFVHYVYRTYENFLKGVEAGEVHWENYDESAPSIAEKWSGSRSPLDVWGFELLNAKELVRENGSATLSEASSAVKLPRKYGPRWDNALSQEIGYTKRETYVTKAKARSLGLISDKHDAAERGLVIVRGKTTAKVPNLSLTPDQRTSLGLRPLGRLSKAAEKQILAHRERTGDPNSLPEKLEEESPTPSRKPLMSAEERIAQGLPARGRLGIQLENKIRKERGLDKLPKKPPKKPKADKPIDNGPALLSREQRLAFGWKGHGRLPQDLMDGLRAEREKNIPLEESLILPKYMDILRAKAGTPVATEPVPSSVATPNFDDQTPGVSDNDVEALHPPKTTEAETQSPSTPAIPEKRASPGEDRLDQSPKRPRLSGTMSQRTQSVESDASVTSKNGTLESTSIVAKGSADTLEQGAVTNVERIANLPVQEAVIVAGRSATSPLPAPPALPEILEPSHLDLQAQSQYEQYLQRSDPGLYVNPFAKRKVGGRGRPRIAFMATFRLPQLKDLEWFKAIYITLDRPKPKSQARGNRFTATFKLPQLTDFEWFKSQADPLTSMDLIHERDTNMVLDGEENGNDRTRTAVRAEQSDVVPEQMDIDETHRTEIEMYKAQTNLQAEAPIGGHTEVDMNGQCSHSNDSVANRASIEMCRPPTSFTAINTASPSSPAPVHSQRAQSVVSDAVTPIRALTGTEEPLPEGTCAIPALQDTVPSQPKPRAKKKITCSTSSGLAFRRQIIMEIMDLCNGVFPDGGEIGRPFHSLWLQRHGHKEGVKEPISSTVLSTMRGMCNPKLGLKRMVFLVKNKHNPLTTEKAIITYARLTPNSPEVLQLAFKMANFSSEKSHQYFPEEIQHLLGENPLYPPLKEARKDESIILEQLKPGLEDHIVKAAKRQRFEQARQKKIQLKAREKQNAQVEASISKEDTTAAGPAHSRRTRLASLNDKSKRYRPAVLGDTSDSEHEEDAQNGIDRPLDATQPFIFPGVATQLEEEHEKSGTESEESEDEVEKSAENDAGRSRTASMVASDQNEPPTEPTDISSNKKRPNSDSGEQSTRKRVRFNILPSVHMDDAESVADTSAECIVQPDEAEAESAVDADADRTAFEKPKQQVSRKPEINLMPTLLERLTGLTGDPNAPIYQPVHRGPRAPDPRSWQERKAKLNPSTKMQKGEQIGFDVLDAVDRFKKLCCTLVIASSMCDGTDEDVDWSIVEIVYSNDKFFNLAKTKKLWTWMLSNMAVQINQLMTTFQTSYIEGYERGDVLLVEDADSYDWRSLVHWAMRTCAHPEMLLPRHRAALAKFQVVESNYESLDRVAWHKANIGDRVRIELQLRCPFASRLYPTRFMEDVPESQVLKARSWVRANTATPQELYNGNQAHEKFLTLDESVVTSVVGDLVVKSALRMRKLKRLLPGRNYNFTKTFAKKFVRNFEPLAFIAAVETKQRMDVAFADEDPDKRFYSMSTSEEDASIMAILTLLSHGQVTLIPQVPPVNNELAGPLPRLSVWGFGEGEYSSRNIDRSRFFWDIHVVPTPSYEFGNPLHSVKNSPATSNNEDSTGWASLPLPPLPGKEDDNACLPIWSTIDGQSIIWSWWYRILVLVLQPLMFQPGATVDDIFAHCAEHTTEKFEIKLILDWLESIGGVSKSLNGRYTTLPGVWAAFGEKLLDTEDDWFGDHVRHKITKYDKLERYNLRHADLLASGQLRTDRDSTEEDQDPQVHHTERALSTMEKQILQYPKAQYGISQRVHDRLDSVETASSPASMPEYDQGEQANGVTPGETVSQTVEVDPVVNGDVEMNDVDAEGEDVDMEL
ncbi:hypothetical protein IQ07DRAFT_658608 [Pyrenochaeta sp. DS3sAY3a]|nr:hypothetical protein IQ07DRAFT_658608 [Pyrenochaeta sp. DS3sAY3a]